MIQHVKISNDKFLNKLSIEMIPATIETLLPGSTMDYMDRTVLIGDNSFVEYDYEKHIFNYMYELIDPETNEFIKIFNVTASLDL